MEPYTITQATLVTYSGKRVPIIPSKEIFTKPIRIIKDAILDGFVKACKGSRDPFVRIEVRTQPVFQPLNKTMKKKWIALKRKWKKLNEFERTYFKVDSIFLIAGMVLLVTGIESGYFLVGWMFSNILLRIAYLAKNRTSKYSSYKDGRRKQKRIDSKDIQTVLRRYQEVDFKNARLHSDYKKLEYDYNQLKKSINPKKKKK